MRLLSFMVSAVVLAGCSTGAGMQATPPAPIAQSAGSTAYTAPQTTNETAPEDAAEADGQAPVSQSEEGSIPTGSGGRFLLN